ncbi:MAG: DegT/DnrJ/EryC1/StrS family aminotransferase [Chloroflexi bacterium]|nr:DegT/DnrJ/EryC1/StrS family aminotransferase [Chloroflexota bacterium]
MKIPLGKPFIGKEEFAAVEKVLASRRLATGELVKEFEDALTRKFGRKYCIAVNSGTSALYLGLKALGVRRVIIPTITCGAVLNAALNAGARVVFSDVERDTHNIDLSTLSEGQLSGADAVIVTHTYGQAADMDRLDQYLKKHGLTLVEDFAQAIGANYKGRPTGSFGRIAVTSFYASKGITTGHGGAVLTDDEELALKCLYGRGSRTPAYFTGLIPMNIQMTDIQAAIGLVQMKKMDGMIEMRRTIAGRYLQGLAGVLGTIGEKPWTSQVYYKFAAILPDGVEKQAFIQRMGEQEIEVGTLFDPPLHRTQLAADVGDGQSELPVAERLAPRTVSLPMFPELSEPDIQRICQATRSTIPRLIADSR